ncbi:MAG: GNAT family N-acetyltransferase [Symbiobacteriaceae bacterium]|nr:GNAT family N-acetyltransferase [Symbiobacteriaceae bacterium]
MNEIVIRQATPVDIPLLEGILLDAVHWVAAIGYKQWSPREVSWENLSKSFSITDFHLAFGQGQPAGCMALVDYDPYFWPEEPRGNSLFLHKLAVTQAARKSGVSSAMMDYFKAEGKARGVTAIQLETNADRPKLTAFYESHGFVFVKMQHTKNEFRDLQTAFYKYEIVY